MKTSKAENIVRAFGQNMDQSRINSILHMQGELSKSIRDADKGFYPLGPLMTFKHTTVRKAVKDSETTDDEIGRSKKSPPRI